MAAFTDRAGAAGYLRNERLGDNADTERRAQRMLLDELAGLAFAIVTLVWIVGSFVPLL